jgi:hypothetical protein
MWLLFLLFGNPAGLVSLMSTMSGHPAEPPPRG